MKKIVAFMSIITLAVGLLTACTSSETSLSKDEKEKALPTENQVDNTLTEQEKQQNAESPPQGYQAKVLSVVDGDTIKVQLANGMSETIRLILVDTPETKHPRLGVQPFGPEASSYTKKELTGKDVTLELDIEQRDKYGRLLAYVWIGTTLFNERLIEEGLARVAIFPPNTKYVDQFLEVQEKAKADGVGIWSIEDYAKEDGYNSDGTPQEQPVPATNSGGSYINDPSDDIETNLACKGKIKGNANSKIYHVPGGRYYESTKDNIVWFCSEEDAQAAGFRKSKQ
ncbi:thermonuclease family protein [Neobacillus sp. LXY-4]|uniref:thermonuclease family protein n=1 Tax=Neobacillus sp. LXY-4 TaxID=3379826 RepID=UPI003EE3A2A3